MGLRSRLLKLHPATLIAGGFAAAVALGTVLLMMPFATLQGFMPFIDALFTSTSAVCVTGLVVVDTGTYFTIWGQYVILLLLQLGGLGVMTISVALYRWLGRSISFRQRMALQNMFAHTPREDMLGLLRSVFAFTFIAELAGALLLTIHFWRYYPLLQALHSGVFHSVSAFCNAGFSIYSDSLMPYSASWLLNFTICGLIVLGGLGFPVLHDLRRWYSQRHTGSARLFVQTKVVLVTTGILIVAGACLFAFVERQSLIASNSFSHEVLVPFFQSITCRTAGFNTVDIGSLKDVTLLLMMLLMFFGASPGSCGGGVKTTTLAILAAFTFSRVFGRKRANLFKKSLPEETVSRSVSLILVSISIILLVLVMLLFGDSASGHLSGSPRGSFIAYLFETVSAFGTVGLSMGITPHLDLWGKIWITVMMFIGRVGILTFAYIFVSTRADRGVEYSEQNMMVG